ncbi:Protease [Drechslerella dactyloides]|uniref:Protease n=1 Tax=Drechslerella dactyloides TaxID=74499 RepID=A0AAD6IT14_DREDA|nr:Protease [Drechslerella dactyloides]
MRLPIPRSGLEISLAISQPRFSIFLVLDTASNLSPPPPGFYNLGLHVHTFDTSSPLNPASPLPGVAIVIIIVAAGVRILGTTAGPKEPPELSLLLPPAAPAAAGALVVSRGLTGGLQTRPVLTTVMFHPAVKREANCLEFQSKQEQFAEDLTDPAVQNELVWSFNRFMDVTREAQLRTYQGVVDLTYFTIEVQTRMLEAVFRIFKDSDAECRKKIKQYNREADHSQDYNQDQDYNRDRDPDQYSSGSESETECYSQSRDSSRSPPRSPTPTPAPAPAPTPTLALGPAPCTPATRSYSHPHSPAPSYQGIELFPSTPRIAPSSPPPSAPTEPAALRYQPNTRGRFDRGRGQGRGVQRGALRGNQGRGSLIGYIKKPNTWICPDLLANKSAPAPLRKATSSKAQAHPGQAANNMDRDIELKDAPGDAPVPPPVPSKYFPPTDHHGFQNPKLWQDPDTIELDKEEILDFTLYKAKIENLKEELEVAAVDAKIEAKRKELEEIMKTLEKKETPKVEDPKPQEPPEPQGSKQDAQKEDTDMDLGITEAEKERYEQRGLNEEEQVVETLLKRLARSYQKGEGQHQSLLQKLSGLLDENMGKREKNLVADVDVEMEGTEAGTEAGSVTAKPTTVRTESENADMEMGETCQPGNQNNQNVSNDNQDVNNRESNNRETGDHDTNDTNIVLTDGTRIKHNPNQECDCPWQKTCEHCDGWKQTFWEGCECPTPDLLGRPKCTKVCDAYGFLPKDICAKALKKKDETVNQRNQPITSVRWILDDNCEHWPIEFINKLLSNIWPLYHPKLPLRLAHLAFRHDAPALPEVNGYNMAMITTDKFSKKKKILPGKETWSAGEWGAVFFDEVFCDWGLPTCVISDRDPKFLSSFWKGFLARGNVKQCLKTAYHPQSDGQSERSNQTVEVALRFWLSNGNGDINWVSARKQIEFDLNNSIVMPSGRTPNEIAYGQELKSLSAAFWPGTEEMNEETREILRQEVLDLTGFANEYVRRRFDDGHEPPPNWKEGDYVMLDLKKQGSKKGYSSKFNPLLHKLAA